MALLGVEGGDTARAVLAAIDARAGLVQAHKDGSCIRERSAHSDARAPQNKSMRRLDKTARTGMQVTDRIFLGRLSGHSFP